jgi:hypothetical protein
MAPVRTDPHSKDLPRRMNFPPAMADYRFKASGIQGQGKDSRQMPAGDNEKMDNMSPVPLPKPFIPHPNFSDEVNRNIVQSEIEGGVYLDDLSEGAVLEVETQHH